MIKLYGKGNKKRKVMDKVVFDEKLPDGTYMGRWKNYEVKVSIKGETFIGKCEVGLTNDYEEFCVVKVNNGQATVVTAG